LALRHTWIGPVVVLVGRGDKGEPAVVLKDALQQLDRVVVMLVADAVAVVAGGGDLEQERLPAGAGRGLQYIDHVAGLMGMELVDDRAVHVEAVHGAGVGGQRHEARGAGRDVQVVDQHRDPAPEGRRAVDHALGLVEHDPRLVAGGRGRVDLGALLAVGDQEVETDPGRERALAVLPRHRAVGGAEAAEAIGGLPAEQTAHHERLPGGQGKSLPGPLALGVTKEAEEVDRVARGRTVEPEPSGCRRAQVLEMALAGQTDDAVGEDAAFRNSLRGGRNRVVLGPSHGL
jgi:hypothetical protein